MVKTQEQNSAREQVQSFLLVIFTAVASATAFVFFLVYYYGPEGSYIAKNILLSPEVMENLNYTDVDRGSGLSSRYVFDKVEFLHFDKYEGKWSRQAVDRSDYASFYATIANAKSILEDEADVAGAFAGYDQASLLLYVIPKSTFASGKEGSKVFQEVHFAKNGDLFRIELHSEKMGGGWVYFRQADIYSDVTRHFVQKNE